MLEIFITLKTGKVDQGFYLVYLISQMIPQTTQVYSRTWNSSVPGLKGKKIDSYNPYHWILVDSKEFLVN